MAIIQPLFQQNDTTDQSANVMRLFLRDLLGSSYGVINETSMQAVERAAGANNSVDISVGGVVVPGSENGLQGYYYVYNDAVVNLPMSTGAHGSLPRIDSVLVEVRDSFYSGVSNDARLVYQAGTAAGSPVAPNLVSLGYKNFYEIARITVPAADNTIQTADITDRRLVAPQGRAVALGGITTCTTATRPTLPRLGQFIWLSDTKRVEVNEGTPSSPNWVVYAVPGSGSWTNYTPSFGGLSGGSNTVYGRFFRLGSLVVGICGFTIGSGGDVTGTLTASLPASFPVQTVGPAATAAYIGFGRAYDVGAPTVYWSGSAEIVPSGGNMANFATAGTAGWNATIPFNWVVGDAMKMLFVYETAA